MELFKKIVLFTVILVPGTAFPMKRKISHSPEPSAKEQKLDSINLADTNETISVTTSDNKEFIIDRSIARRCNNLHTMINDLDDDGSNDAKTATIPLYNISAETFKIVIGMLKLPSDNDRNDALCKLNGEQLAHVIDAVQFLDNKPLFDILELVQQQRKSVNVAPLANPLQVLLDDTIGVQQENQTQQAEAVATSVKIYKVLAEIENNRLEEKLKNSSYWKRKTLEEKQEDAQELVKNYKIFESCQEVIKGSSFASMWGGINYAMSIEEMRDVATAKFNDLKKAGLIISEDEFEKVKAAYYIPRCPHTDLSRLWGAEILKHYIAQSEKLAKCYDVPEYVIVANDLTSLEVTIYLGNMDFPIISHLDNANLYFRKIEGARVACEVKFSAYSDLTFNEIAYRDFSDPGNIICDKKSGKYFIVDTEYKSFDILFNNVSFEESNAPLRYSYKRFCYLNPGISYSLVHVIEFK